MRNGPYVHPKLDSILELWRTFLNDYTPFTVRYYLHVGYIFCNVACYFVVCVINSFHEKSFSNTISVSNSLNWSAVAKLDSKPRGCGAGLSLTGVTALCP